MKIVRPNNEVTVNTTIVKKPIVDIKKGDLIKVKSIEFTVKNAKKEENKIFIETEEDINISKQKEEKATIENLMNELLPKISDNDEKNITFEITLTRRQKEIYDQKGGISWLKKCIDRNVSVKPNKRKK